MLGWNVPADALKQIPEHWLAYEEPEASLHYLLGILYIAFTIFSLVGNGLVIWIFSWYDFYDFYSTRNSSTKFNFKTEKYFL